MNERIEESQEWPSVQVWFVVWGIAYCDSIFYEFDEALERAAFIHTEDKLTFPFVIDNRF